ncbi:MAG TPA: hypothetical protein VFN60_03260 [Acidimicrobiales bacterium]|nr:hypothetical protein [Acidimicrobiales bacterium]
MAATLAAAGLALAGCGTSPGRTAGGTGPTGQAAGLSATGDSGATSRTGDSGPASRPGPPAAVHDHGQATALARAVLARASLPPGARPVGHPPSAALRRPPEAPATSQLAQATRYAVTDQTATATFTYLSRHPPAGATTGGGSGRTTGAGGTTERYLLEPVGHLPPGAASAELLVTVTPLASGGTGIRVDAQVTWLATRPAASLVPASDRVAVVSVLHRLTGTTTRRVAPSRRVVVTDPAAVARLRAAANGLAPASAGVISCPTGAGTVDVVAFAATATAAPDLVLRSGSCGQVTVSAGAGRPITVLRADAEFTAAFRRALDPAPRQ